MNNKQRRPSIINELEFRDISESPEGRALERPLHPNKMRVWQPSVKSSRSGPCSPSTSPKKGPPPRRSLYHRRVSLYFNNGSDDDTDDDNDKEEDTVASFIPRVFRSMMEASLDPVVAEEVTDGDLALAGGNNPEDVLQSTTEQPWGLYVFDWRAFPNPPTEPESRREIFSQINVGPTTPCADPYEIFVEIWDRQIMEHIASETNKYAQRLVSQMLKNDTLNPKSRIKRWFDTTADELYIYIGMILAMGIVIKSRLEEYWGSNHDIFYTPGFSAHMPINRYLILSKCLHFNDNDDMCALKLDNSAARLFKIHPILRHLNKKFETMYTPGQNIALDESLLMWKGVLDINQQIPNKAANRGIKTYEICESHTGYLWQFEVHVHKKSPSQQNNDPLEASTRAIVLQLIRGLEHKGYTLWMDNYYNSPALARRLKCLGFDCVGTLRTDRKFVTNELRDLTKTNMTPRQITGFTSGDVDIMVWRDVGRMATISTYHGNAQKTVRGSTKPILIMDYNIMMGGVDKKDQLLAMYPIERKRTQVWYKKLFRRLLNVSVLNSYIIHKHNSNIDGKSTALCHRNFRISLIKSLLSKYYTPSPIPSPPKRIKPDLMHRLAAYPLGKGQRKRKTCAVCKKRVQTYCVGCDKTACIKNCFLKIHA